MGRRRRRSSAGTDGIALVVLLGAAVVAAIGLYLLIAAAIAVVGWLVATVVRNTRTTSPQRIEQVAAPIQDTYRELARVAPSVFEDSTAVREAATMVFTAWASTLPSAPRQTRHLVQNVAVSNRLIGRLTTRLDGRRFVWRAGPYRGHERRQHPAVSIDALDPYNPPHDLRALSRCVELCGSCSGSGKCTCGACGGAGVRPCVDCQGAGKVQGLTKNGARRLLNCKTCKGKATLRCSACTRGELSCATCDSSGRTERWLELEGGPRDGDVQVEPDGDQTRAFVWGKDGVSAGRETVLRDATLVCEVTADRALTELDLPRQVPVEWRHANWSGIQARLQPGEKIISQTFELLEIPRVDVTYRLGDTQQVVQFEGRRMLAPPASVDRIFHARASALRRLAWFLAFIPPGIGFIYLARGNYFAKPEVAGLLLCASLSALLVYIVARHATAGHQAAFRWLGLGLIPLASAVVLAIVAEPSAARVNDYLASGQLDAAERELDALGATSGPLRDELWVRRVLADSDAKHAHANLAHISAGAKRAAEATAHVDKLALTAATTAISRSDFARANEMLALRSAAAQADSEANALRIQMLDAEATRCLTSRTWTCVADKATALEKLAAVDRATSARSKLASALLASSQELTIAANHERALGERITVTERALASWRDFGLYVAPPDPKVIADLQKRLETDRSAAQRIAAAEAKKREAEERKRLAAEALARKREEAAEARARNREEQRARREEQQQRWQEAQQRSCCKVCTGGCACGDTCISCSKTCHKGPGCAC